MDPQNCELMVSQGAFVENLSLAAGANGVSTDIQVTARNPHDRKVIRVALDKDRPNDYPLHRIKKHRTVKQGHLPREISTADIKILCNRMGKPLFYFPRGSNHAACIREAAVENHRLQAWRDDAQRELVRWLRLNHRDTKRHRDGLTTEGMEILGFKGWLVITRPGQSVADLIETARRFEHMALLARENGIGIHPMTQMFEEKNGIEQIAGSHGDGFFPQFVLRVGYLEKYPEPVSLRRPVEWFVTT